MKRHLISLAVCSLLGSMFTPVIAAPDIASAKIDYRKVNTQLPRHVRPIHYDVSIKPDAAQARLTAKLRTQSTVLSARHSLTP